MRRPLALLLATALAACTVERDLGTTAAPAPTSTDTPREASLVFVTQGRFTGNLAQEGGASTGPAGADALCALEAKQAKLEGTFVAWLATEGEDASARVGALGPYRRVDGATAFPGKVPVGAPLVALSVTPTGETLKASDDAAVWTGTADVRRCQGFTSARAEVSGAIGSALATDATWTSDGRAVRPCDVRARLYCFQR